MATPDEGGVLQLSSMFIPTATLMLREAIRDAAATARPTIDRRCHKEGAPRFSRPMCGR